MLEELNKFQKANIRRVYQMTKMTRRKVKKLEEKINALQEEKILLDDQISSMEAIILPYSEGLNAEEAMKALGYLVDEEQETSNDEPVNEMQEESIQPEVQEEEQPEWMRVAEEELK